MPQVDSPVGLLKTGHPKTDLPVLTGVSVCSVKRIPEFREARIGLGQSFESRRKLRIELDGLFQALLGFFHSFVVHTSFLQQKDFVKILGRKARGPQLEDFLDFRVGLRKLMVPVVVITQGFMNKGQVGLGLCGLLQHRLSLFEAVVVDKKIPPQGCGFRK